MSVRHDNINKYMNRCHLEKLTVAQLVSKLLVFYGTQRLNVVFTHPSVGPNYSYIPAAVPVLMEIHNSPSVFSLGQYVGCRSGHGIKLR
jgi:hypothetical protein